jgi:hypothetical protein
MGRPRVLRAIVTHYLGADKVLFHSAGQSRGFSPHFARQISDLNIRPGDFAVLWGKANFAPVAFHWIKWKTLPASGAAAAVAKGTGELGHAIE